jgi:hypothetical protein
LVSVSHPVGFGCLSGFSLHDVQFLGGMLLLLNFGDWKFVAFRKQFPLLDFNTMPSFLNESKSIIEVSPDFGSASLAF